MTSSLLELTLAIVKPHASKVPNVVQVFYQKFHSFVVAIVNSSVSVLLEG